MVQTISCPFMWWEARAALHPTGCCTTCKGLPRLSHWSCRRVFLQESNSVHLPGRKDARVGTCLAPRDRQVGQCPVPVPARCGPPLRITAPCATPAFALFLLPVTHLSELPPGPGSHLLSGVSRSCCNGVGVTSPGHAKGAWVRAGGRAGEHRGASGCGGRRGGCLPCSEQRPLTCSFSPRST